MAALRKLNKKLDKMFDRQVAAREESGCTVLSGELERWSDIVLAGMTAVKYNPYPYLVSEIQCTGETVLPIRKPRFEDSALEWEEPDVLIIGGGVVGCAIARELSRYSLSVLLVEKEHDLAMQTSGRNDGMVHSGVDLKKSSQKYKYNKLGNQMFGDVCAELGVSFERSGQFLCFARRIWEPFMFLSLIYWRWLGLKGVKVIGKEKLHKLEPALNPGIGAALFFPDTGVVCPFSLTIAYAENAVQNGVNISLDTMVREIKTEDGMITSVTTNRGTIRPKAVVNAAGLFCEDISAMAGDRFYSIHPRKGTNVILDKKYTGELVRTAVSTLVSASGRKKQHSKGGGIIRTIDGNTLVGPDALETINKEDFTTLSHNVSEIISTHSRTIPSLDERQIITYFSGIRAATYEEDFVVRRGRYVTNMIHAAGIQSPGLTAAPAIGVDVARMVLELFGGEDSVEANAEFDPVRIAPPRPALMDIEARAELIKSNPDYGIIVCRCEEISKGEIIEALNRNVPCDTIDGVRRRVRPGTGRCQGGFCGPQVLEIIAAEKRLAPHKVQKSGGGSELLYGSSKAATKKKKAETVSSNVTKADPEKDEIMREHAKRMLAFSASKKKDEDTDDFK